MEITVVKAVLCALIYYLGKSCLTPNLGMALFSQPLVGGMWVGIILGDLKTGIAAGITIQLVYMGTMMIGGIMPADSAIAGVIGSALAIALKPSLGFDPALAAGLSLAVAASVPAATIVTMLNTISTVTIEKSRKSALHGDDSGQRFWHWGVNEIIKFGFYFTICFLALMAIGNEASLNAITNVVKPISAHLSMVGKVLPAVGLALILKVIGTKSTMPFFIIGFILSAYFKMPIIGVAIFGGCVAYLISFVFNKEDEQKQENADFLDEELSIR